MTGKVRIEPIDEGPCYNVFVNDKEIEHCTGVYFQLLPDRIPDVMITLGYTPEYEGDASVRFRYSPEAIETAKKIIATCLNNDDDFSDELFEAINNSPNADSAYDAVCECFGAKGYK